jgi:septal ring factor EnvC (AmiA/AmiB activator)
MRIFSSFVTALVLCLACPPLKAAEKANPAEQKMRETIRNTMIQLRDANAKLAVAQTAQADAEEKVKELQGRLDELIKKSEAEHKSDTATIEDLKGKLSASDMQVIHLNDSLSRWKQGYAKLADYAKATEAKRADLASKLIIEDRKLADQQTRNAEMYRLSMELLDRYANFGLGTAIAAREPFVGVTRVKFQNLVQDYQNKLTDQTQRHDDKPAPGQSPQAQPAKKAD